MGSFKGSVKRDSLRASHLFMSNDNPFNAIFKFYLQGYAMSQVWFYTNSNDDLYESCCGILVNLTIIINTRFYRVCLFHALTAYYLSYK